MRVCIDFNLKFIIYLLMCCFEFKLMLNLKIHAWWGLFFAKIVLKKYLTCFVCVNFLWFVVVLSRKQGQDRLATVHYLHGRFCKRLEDVVAWMDGGDSMVVMRDRIQLFLFE